MSGLAEALEALDEAMLRLDTGTAIEACNPAAARLFGYDPSGPVGRPLLGFIASEHHDRVRGWFAEVCQGASLRHREARGVHRSGGVLELSFTLSPIVGDDGHVIGVSAMASDVSRQRWMAATLESTLESLERALDEARDSESRFRGFLADAAHQLRTPIAGVQSCAETLLRSPPAAVRDGLLANLVRETTRAGRLLTGLLHIARLDQGEPFAPRPCDLAALCVDECDRARVLAGEVEIDVRVGNTGNPLYLDPSAIREVVSNLLDNARRHAASRVEVVVDIGCDMAEVRVSDDGPGVPAGLEERVFDRFASLDGKGGSGLGLAIGRQVARAHDGDLTYENRAFVLRVATDLEPVDCGGAGRPTQHPLA